MKQVNGPRNVVVVMADDLGYGDLGRFNFGASRTPNLDELIQRGLLLSQHYSAAPVCAPARAGFLTGRYPHRTGALDTIEAYGHDRLFLRERTIAEVLAGAGWTTGLIGKWHNGAFDERYHPCSRGFHEFFGFCGGWQDYYDYRLDANGTTVRGDGSYLTHRLTDQATAFIARHAKEPFFLCVTYNAPHYPFQAPDATLKRFRDEGLGIGVACVYAMIEEMDKGVGRIVEALGRNGLLDETMVIFTSDNGPQFGGEGAWSTVRYNCGFAGHKGHVWEGGIRLPAIVRWDGQIEPGTVSHEMCHLCDWFPSICELAGIDTSLLANHLDGVSIAPLLRGEPRPDYPERYWQWNRFEPVWGCNAAMRDGDWKLVVPAIDRFLAITEADRSVDEVAKVELDHVIDRPAEDRGVPVMTGPYLYDLRTDPLETTDCSAQQAGRASRMLTQLERWFVEVVADYHEERER